jgi:hypothetical protein
VEIKWSLFSSVPRSVLRRTDCGSRNARSLDFRAKSAPRNSLLVVCIAAIILFFFYFISNLPTVLSHAKGVPSERGLVSCFSLQTGTCLPPPFPPSFFSFRYVVPLGLLPLKLSKGLSAAKTRATQPIPKGL